MQVYHSLLKQPAPRTKLALHSLQLIPYMLQLLGQLITCRLARTGCKCDAGGGHPQTVSLWFPKHRKGGKNLTCSKCTRCCVKPREKLKQFRCQPRNWQPQAPSPPTSGTAGPSYCLNTLWCQDTAGSYLLSSHCISTPWSQARNQLTKKRQLHRVPRLVNPTCEDKHCH